MEIVFVVIVELFQWLYNKIEELKRRVKRG